MKNSPEECTITLSPFERSVQTFIDSAKTVYEEAKENYITAKYLEKYQWINHYINSKQIFHLNEFFEYVSEMKDLCGDRDKKLPDKKTISRYLYTLFKLQFLEHKPVPSNYPNMYKIYWIPTIEPEHKKLILKSYFESYKEPKNKKEKRSREEKIITDIQSRIDNYTSKTFAEKILQPLKQQEKELDLETKAENQKIYLEKQQEKVFELQKETEPKKVFTKALVKEKQKTADKIIKNTLLQQQKEQTIEERMAQNEVILTTMEEIGIAIPNEKLLSLEKKKEKLQSASKKKKQQQQQISEESFVDSDYSEVLEEVV